MDNILLQRYNKENGTHISGYIKKEILYKFCIDFICSKCLTDATNIQCSKCMQWECKECYNILEKDAKEIEFLCQNCRG